MALVLCYSCARLPADFPCRCSFRALIPPKIASVSAISGSSTARRMESVLEFYSKVRSLLSRCLCAFPLRFCNGRKPVFEASASGHGDCRSRRAAPASIRAHSDAMCAPLAAPQGLSTSAKELESNCSIPSTILCARQ